jgi:hypothetical protein
MNKFCRTGLAWVLVVGCMAAGPRPAPAPQAPLADARPDLRQAILGASARPVPRPQIQLGAFRDQASAEQGWAKIAALVGPPLNALTPAIVPVDLPGKGRFWRVRVRFDSATDAKAVCAVLRARAIACITPRD